MKKIMKILAAGISTVIGISALMPTASAYEILPSDYALDEGNVVWTASEENGVSYSETCPVKCYEDGSIIAERYHKYALYFTPTTGYMDSLMPQQWDEYCLGEFPDNTYVLYAEDEAGLESLCNTAQTWFDDGKIIYAKVAEVMVYECITDMGIEITLKEADPTYNPQEYEGVEDISYSVYEEGKVYKISSETDDTKLAEIMTQIKNDERVESYYSSAAWCCMIHTAADVVLSLESIEMAEPDSFAANTDPEAVEEAVWGDVNADGGIDVADIVSLNMYLLSPESVSLTDNGFVNANCNFDELIDSTDSAALMNFVSMAVEYSTLGVQLVIN